TSRRSCVAPASTERPGSSRPRRRSRHSVCARPVTSSAWRRRPVSIRSSRSAVIPIPRSACAAITPWRRRITGARSSAGPSAGSRTRSRRAPLTPVASPTSRTSSASVARDAVRGPAADYRQRVGSDALDRFHPAVSEWFRTSFAAPTRAQSQAWPVIKSGENTLLMAPTGSGKTLAAFLSSIDMLVQSPQRGCRVVYVSPLKALAVDVERNLRAPIAGIRHAAERLGHPVREPSVAIRTGDTPAKERVRFSKTPTDIFITTPESLYLVLSSSAGAALKDVETVIVDEIHAMVSTKRGTHLALTLERLERLAA